MLNMHNSGKHERFGDGAVRDTAEGKPRLELISPFFNDRIGHWLRMGAEKYDPRNWEKGMPFSRVTASMARHLNAWMAGDGEEDHLSAIAVNAMFLIHYQEMVKRGQLPVDLCDMPDYSNKRKERAPTRAELATIFSGDK